MPNGILITKSVTINGGTYDDPSNFNPHFSPGGLKPIIRIKDTAEVTIENVVLNGVNPGGFHRDLVGEAGIDVLSSDHVSITNVSINNTFGDGMTLFANIPKDKSPTTNLTVDGVTITNAGRQGLTIADVMGGTISNVDVVSSASMGWDFESDIGNVGSGYLTINNPVSRGGMRFIESLHGPITVNNCTCSRHVTDWSGAAASGEPITFNGGSIPLARSDNGMPPGGIFVAGPGHLVFNHVALGLEPGTSPPKGPSWYLTGGAHLELDESPVAGPPGYHDAASAVTIVP